MRVILIILILAFALNCFFEADIDTQPDQSKSLHIIKLETHLQELADAEDRILQARSKLFQNVFNLTEKKKLHDTLISSVKMNLNLQKHIRESHVTKTDEWNKSKQVLLDSIKWSEHSGNDRKWNKLINDCISQIATRRKILNQALARERIGGKFETLSNS